MHAATRCNTLQHAVTSNKVQQAVFFAMYLDVIESRLHLNRGDCI